MMRDGGGGNSADIVSSSLSQSAAASDPMVEYLLKGWQGLGTEVGIGSSGTANAEIGGRKLADVAADFANKFRAQGITDLSTQKFTAGQQASWTAEGHGNVSLMVGQGGRLVPVWGSSSDAGKARTVALAIASAAFAPGLAGALGGGLTGAAGAGAILGGTRAAISGGDILKGALTGGVTGGVGFGVSEFASPLIADASKSIGEATTPGIANIAKGAMTGAVKSGTQAALSGQSIADALLTGGVGGGISSAIGSATKSILPAGAGNAANLAVTGVNVANKLSSMDGRAAKINQLKNLITARKAGKTPPGG